MNYDENCSLYVNKDIENEDYKFLANNSYYQKKRRSESKRNAKINVFKQKKSKTNLNSSYQKLLFKDLTD